MIERIIKFSTLPGEAICDVFSGTGTVLRAVNNLSFDLPDAAAYVGPRNPVTSIELSPRYCWNIAGDHGLEIEMFDQAKQTA